MHILNYLDDWLAVAQSVTSTQAQTARSFTLSQVDRQYAEEHDTTQPTHHIPRVGMNLDVTMRAHLSQEVRRFQKVLVDG